MPKKSKRSDKRELKSQLRRLEATQRHQKPTGDSFFDSIAKSVLEGELKRVRSALERV